MTSRRVSLVLVATLGVLAVGIIRADAQVRPPEPTGFQVGVGAGWLGGAALGEQPADLRAGGSGGTYRLFDSDSAIDATGTFEVRVGVGLTPRYAIEGRAAISKPDLVTVVTSDLEASGTFTLAERIDQYVFDGGIVIRLNELATMGLVPFAAAGVGYVRQLHEGQELVETGSLYYVGGGFTRGLFARAAGFIRAASVRADLRLNVLSLELQEDSRMQGSVTGSLVLTF